MIQSWVACWTASLTLLLLQFPHYNSYNDELVWWQMEQARIYDQAAPARQRQEAQRRQRECLTSLEAQSRYLANSLSATNQAIIDLRSNISNNQTTLALKEARKGAKILNRTWQACH